MSFIAINPNGTKDRIKATLDSISSLKKRRQSPHFRLTQSLAFTSLLFDALHLRLLSLVVDLMQITSIQSLRATSNFNWIWDTFLSHPLKIRSFSTVSVDLCLSLMYQWTFNCSGSDPLRKLLPFWRGQDGFALFLGFFCRTFFLQRHGRFFLGLSAAAPFFRHADSPDKGWVVLMSTYRFSTLPQANVYVFTYMCLLPNP